VKARARERELFSLAFGLAFGSTYEGSERRQGARAGAASTQQQPPV
jgi:hypothetical protein